MAKAYILLSDFLKKSQHYVDGKMRFSFPHCLDFTNGLNLSKFNDILNHNSACKGIHQIHLGYTYYSCFFQEKITVSFEFAADPADALNNGWLNTCSITSPDGSLIYKFQNEISHDINSSTVKTTLINWDKFRAPFKNSILLQLHSLLNTNPKLFGKDKIDITLDQRLDISNLVSKSNISQDIINSLSSTDIITPQISSEEIQSLLEDTFLIIPESINPECREEYLTGHLYPYPIGFNALKILGLESIKNHLDFSDHFTRFFNAFISEIFSVDFIKSDIRYIDSSTAIVKRLYPLDSTDYFSTLYRTYTNAINRIDNDAFDIKTDKLGLPLYDYPFPFTNPIAFNKGMFLRKWLKSFGICHSIKFENNEGFLSIKLITDNDPNGRSLADFGYGVTQLVSLLLNIEIAISKATFPALYVYEYAARHNFKDVAFRIPPTVIVEEPEIHLHPCYQSKLADMLLEASKLGVRFIIETHSEYLIRRSQILMANFFIDNNKDSIEPFAVHYFPMDNKPYKIEYAQNGMFKNKFGSGFYDESANMAFELFNISSN